MAALAVGPEGVGPSGRTPARGNPAGVKPAGGLAALCRVVQEEERGALRAALAEAGDPCAPFWTECRPTKPQQLI